MSSLKDFWDAREKREQILILVMGVSALIALWFVLVSPIRQAHTQAEADLIRAERDYITIARTLPKLGTQPSGTRSTFNQGVFIASAQRRGINPSRIQPDGNNNLTVWIETQDTQALYGLLNDVITRHGAVLSRASIATNANQTLSAQFTFVLTP